MSNPLTFAQLPVGCRFAFLDVATPARPCDGVCVKTGAHTFERHWESGHVLYGRVGVGDNPVVALDRVLPR